VSLLETVLPELATLCGASTEALDVGWTDKAKGSNPLRLALAPLLRAVGCDEFELYISSTDRGIIAVVGADPIAVVLGAGVTAPFDVATRHEVVRRALLALRGTAAIAHQGPEAIAEKALAAMAYAELTMATAARRYEHQTRAVSKAMSRRGRKAVADSARALASSPDAWNELARAARAMLSTARRGALAVSGYVEGAARETVSAEALGERAVADMLARDSVGRELALYCVSDALAHMVRELGTDRK
jgi:hypothetical protein